MKQTNNWEKRFDKEFENKYRHARNTDATEHCDESCDIRHSHHYHALDQDKQREWIKSFLHQELTNLLKTVAEATSNKLKVVDKYDRPFVEGFNQAIDQIISNISEKYPEFINYLKK